MKIGLLPLAAGRRAGGPEIYEVQLIRSLARLDSRNEYVVYCTSPDAAEAIGVDSGNVKCRVLWPRNRMIALSATLPYRMLRDGIDLLHCMYAPPPVSSVPYVFTLHCTSNLAHPEFYDDAKVFRLNALQKMGLRRARYIMCVSQFIRTYLADEYMIPDDRTGVVYNGVSPEFRPIPAAEARAHLRARWGLEDPYFLYVGKLQARKNVVRLIEAFARYRQMRPSPVKLVLAGARTEKSGGIDEAIAKFGLADSVVRLGYVDPPGNGSLDLPALYSASRLFVLPSLYEGFGIPLVEAMACGTPVITSSTTCLPEVAGDAALIVDPLSVDSIANAMLRLDTETATRDRLIGSGLKRAAEFSWDRCAHETMAAYERCQVREPRRKHATTNL